MLLELSDRLSLRELRLEVCYTAARLKALEETRGLAGDFDEAQDKLSLLEAEEERLDLAQVETEAMVKIADDAWDDTVIAFRRRLLDLAGNSHDDPLYRRYFAEIPSDVTELSYAAEIMISKDLEADLAQESESVLAVFAERLARTRGGLEAALQERTRLEVEVAKFDNRCALARALVNKLRRMLLAQLEELATARELGAEWTRRFFYGEHAVLETVELDGGERGGLNGDASEPVIIAAG